MITKRNPTVVTTIRLAPEKYERMKAIAEREHRSLSQEFRRLVDERIAEFEDDLMPVEQAA